MNPASGPALWHGGSQVSRDDWIFSLSKPQILEIEAAAGALRAGRDPFLPSLEPVIEALRRELEAGRGFALLRGFPSGACTTDELGAIFWWMGTQLGVGVSQSAAGDRIGHVIDRGGTDRKERYYTVGGPLEFHMDPVDVVGLLCVRAALEGGHSRIVSTLALHNVMLEERPDLLELLYRGFHCSRRGHGESTTPWRVPVFAEGASGIESYFLPITIRQAEEEGFPLSEREREAIDYLSAVASRPGVYLDMDLRPGDIQFLNNRVTFHARTDYRDDPGPHRQRHLLRLWLMMPHWPPRAPAMQLHARTDRAGGGVQSGR